ncbi:Hypothetical protein HDN1F_21890 [gamma proteobacterium HdN1]|nr:Hypothetical protein HDN1F_21890 [gamma proteobacterium HdN1]
MNLVTESRRYTAQKKESAMGRSLRSLERPQTLAKTSAASGTDPDTLQGWIDAVRGRTIPQLGRNLRALENQLQGSAPKAKTTRRQALRLDHHQLPAAPTAPINAPAPATAPTTASVTAPGWPSAQTAYAASLWPAGSANQYAQRLPSAATAILTPELSAPDAGRFQVEAFTESEFLAPQLAPAPKLIPAPQLTEARPNDATQWPSAPPVPAISDDGNQWLNQASTPSTGGTSAKLDAGLSLAKDEFERELAAILGQPTPAQQSPTQTTTPTQADTQTQAGTLTPETAPLQSRHDIFDQMGLAMRYANSFDLGKVNLNERFREFEQALEPTRAAPAIQPQPAEASPFANPYVTPMQLDDFDLVAELAEISATQPPTNLPPTSQPNPIHPAPIHPDSTDTSAGEHHE